MPNPELDGTTAAMFKLAVEIENSAAGIYEKFSQYFSYLPDVSAFWAGMRDDEREHAVTLARISEGLSAGQLAAPADGTIWNTVIETRKIFARGPAEYVTTLDDAYEAAHELEFSEVNNIFKFLTSSFVVPEEQEKLLDMQIAGHLKKLMDFSINFGGRQWRKGLKARGR